MKNKEYETWSIGREIAVYTENPTIARLMRKFSERLTVYERRGRIYGWQLNLPKEKMNFFEALYDKEMNVENKQLSGRRIERYADRPIKTSRGISIYSPERNYHECA